MVCTQPHPTHYIPHPIQPHLIQAPHPNTLVYAPLLAASRNSHPIARFRTLDHPPLCGCNHTKLPIPENEILPITSIHWICILRSFWDQRDRCYHSPSSDFRWIQRFVLKMTTALVVWLVISLLCKLHSLSSLWLRSHIILNLVCVHRLNIIMSSLLHTPTMRSFSVFTNIVWCWRLNDWRLVCHASITQKTYYWRAGVGAFIQLARVFYVCMYILIFITMSPYRIVVRCSKWTTTKFRT